MAARHAASAPAGQRRVSRDAGRVIYKPRHNENNGCGRGLVRGQAEACGRTEASLRDGGRTKKEKTYCTYLVSVLGVCYVAGGGPGGTRWQIGLGCGAVRGWAAVGGQECSIVTCH
jgi:hypothetical protein